MKIESINTEFLNRVLTGEEVDIWYHYGLASTDQIISSFKDLKAVITGGSGQRIDRMAKSWAEQTGVTDYYKFPKDERFSAYYVDGVLFSSHGMGMPSASIALQELMKIAYFVKGGDLAELDKIFWARVGTSGGLVNPGTVVLSSEGLQADFKPYRLISLGHEKYFNSLFPTEIIEKIRTANSASQLTIEVGKTIGCNSFYIEQNRIDGAVALATEAEKLHWLTEAQKIGVKNIEMEAPAFASLLNHWGFSKFAVICCTLLNRLEGDQVTATSEQLSQYSANAELCLFNFLKQHCGK